MIFLIVLTLTSFAGVAIALSLPGWADLMLVAGLAAFAGTVLLGLQWVRGHNAKNWVILDGSNVMYWKDNSPDMETVKEVLRLVRDIGYSPCVVFDANAGYLMSDRYHSDRDFSTILGLPEDQVLVVPKGQPADPTILRAARKVGAVVVTNDRFRDWESIHPEVREKGYLVGGGYASGQLWLSLDAA